MLPVAYDRLPAPATPAPARAAETVATVQITAAELRRGDVVLAADGARAYAAFDLRDEPRDANGTRNVQVWTALVDQEAGQPAQVHHKGTDALTVQRPTA